jgi:hypothetical protein
MEDFGIFDSISRFVVLMYPVLTLFGLIGNITAFIIFSRRRFQNTIFSTYFRFFIISDSLALLISINRTLEFIFSIYFIDLSNFTCKLFWYSNYILFKLSGWTMVVISIDRFLSITIPSKFLFRKNKYIQFSTCLFILCFHMIFYCPMLWSFNIIEIFSFDEINTTNITTTAYNNTNFVCDFNYSFPLDIMDIFVGSVIPFSLMILFTILTLKTIFNVRKKTRSNLQNRISDSDNSITTNRSMQNQNGFTSSSKQKDVRFALISVIMNVIFFSLTFPFYFYKFLLYEISLKFDTNISNFILRITALFIYLNFSLVFYINICVNRMFKEEFYVMILRKNEPISTTR